MSHKAHKTSVLEHQEHQRFVRAIDSGCGFQFHQNAPTHDEVDTLSRDRHTLVLPDDGSLAFILESTRVQLAA
jgi:hypothetical protein